ncbi:MAG: iron uptake system protein EfeO [Pseudonocardiaceae bacterium]
MRITLSDTGCEPQPTSVPAGPVTFAITNSGSSKATETEVLHDSKIVGKDSVMPGLSGGFSLRLQDAGAYLIHCPGGVKDTWTFTVTGGPGGPGTGATTTSPTAATQGYHDYVVTEAGLFADATKQFTNAVRAGDMDKAKRTYPLALTHYEHIESVAANFDDLNASIDARAEEVANPADWTGLHRLEKAIWQYKTLEGMSPLADKLDADVTALKSKVAGETYQASELADDANELLNRVSIIAVTGAEERYSHTDLWDIAANIDGARTCFGLLKPALATKDAGLAQQLEARFADIAARLSKYRQGEGYVDYSMVPDDQRREMADSVNALAEPLSKVIGLVV